MIINLIERLSHGWINKIRFYFNKNSYFQALVVGAESTGAHWEVIGPLSIKLSRNRSVRLLSVRLVYVRKVPRISKQLDLIR